MELYSYAYTVVVFFMVFQRSIANIKVLSCDFIK